MTAPVKPITVTIMDKEYVVGCAEDERESLFASVEFLNRKLREQRDSGKVIGSERVAVMAALNIAHEYLDYRRRHDTSTSDIGEGIERIHRKIESALVRGGRTPGARPPQGTN
jgi:cell division protein ZapA